ncbi:MAG: cobyrinate a,c-diamide synthase [Oscillospiraceae bacterium]|nr:cobyrinate a,c-diamide synthase [Oscillospiraceae bacterium]
MPEARIVFAAPSSGSGKTMITCGLLQALKERGLRVASFKCGPDYIDPMFQERVIGVRSGNLDLFFSDAATMRRLFIRDAAGADVSVVEGVMGYYDGNGVATDEASTYKVASALEAPVVLIVDARGQSLSALATLEGFLNFRADSRIRGVILNRTTRNVFSQLRPEIEKLGVAALGFVPKDDGMVVESRHLGLVTPNEIDDLSERLHALAAKLSETVDIDAILSLARSAGPLEAPPEPELPKLPKTRIAAAKDEAFCFYYKDNLRLLESLGAELVYFSPIRDKALPEGAQGLVLPGGYPELYARELAENAGMRASVAAAIADGMPCLAECGGFMYLHRELEDMEGVFHPMCGVIDAKAWRTNKLGRFGYVELTALTDGGLFSKGEKIKAHEFHYFESGDCGEDLLAEKPTGTRSWKCIHAEGNLVAGFPHLFYESDPDLVVRFLRRCAERK